MKGSSFYCFFHHTAPAGFCQRRHSRDGKQVILQAEPRCKGPHEVPVAKPQQAIFRQQSELCQRAARVLEPDLVRLSGLVQIGEIRCLRLLVKLNFRAILRRKQRGSLVPDGLRPRRPRRERQRPVISLIREPQQNLSRLHLRQRKLHHPPHRPNRRHRHRRAIGVAPFI